MFLKKIYSEPHSTRTVIIQPLLEHTSRQWKNQWIKYAKGELISKLTEMKEGGVTYSPQKFGAKYWRSLKLLNLSDKKDILQACGMSDNYTVEFDKGVAVGEEYLACSKESRIIFFRSSGIS